MKLATRAVATAALALGISVGVASVAAPAQTVLSDSSWGWVKAPATTL